MEDDNTATISPMTTTTKNNKSVSFALQIDEEKDNNSLMNIRRTNNNNENECNDKTKSELIDVISKLQIDLRAETAMRRKKDKSLLKLARQLASQAEDIEQLEQHINDVRKKKQKILLSSFIYFSIPYFNLCVSDFDFFTCVIMRNASVASRNIESREIQPKSKRNQRCSHVAVLI